jgi:hypothetical protein
VDTPRFGPSAKQIALLLLPALSATMGFVIWRQLGESAAALVAACPGSMSASAAAVLRHADRCRLSSTARTWWVFAGLASTVAAWCLLLALGV